MKLCGKPARYVYGAEGCPREDGHAGEHYWWIPFEVGNWRVVVYAGEAAERRRVCRGAFTDQPSAQDVYQLLVLVADRRRRELERRGARTHA